ncbi:Flp pilus assembly protein CpaB [Microvirga sp. KLBC 81]|uniref:Flp pilus assembly protein CpaB n=1 Tax=Microvirga sp. KLBC 81 TaxID=1862707 RepID=UPI000D50D4D1|nr:Flp pilus assembly protein CpaB [Microvirga sp. KLBC 81]PVE25663.1 Flp pilus assembly protein CpaB [Microvirga sp. KLBC 81]
MRAGSAISLGVAIVLGGAAAYLSKGLIQPGASGATKSSLAGTAVVAAQPLAFGTPLTPDNVREISWPSENIPDGAFRTVEEFLKDGRRVALASFQKDEPILSQKVTGPNQRATLSTLIEEGKRAVSVRVDEVRGVAGFILPGDRVDVILTRGENSQSSDKASADVLIQNTKVLAIDQIIDEKQEKPTIAKAVTLELDMQQAQKVVLAQGIGRLSLVLRQAGEAEAAPARRVLASELSAGEIIEASRKEAEKVEEKKVPLRAVALVPQPLVNVIRNAVKREQYTVHSERSPVQVTSADVPEKAK